MPVQFGYDVSGTVIAVGASVPESLKPGTEVYSCVPLKYHGTISDYCISVTSATTTRPSSVSHTDAASVPLATLTALQALDRADRHLKGGLAGKTVYVPGGLSSVGAAAVQLAKNVFKASKVITTLSTGKIAKAETLLGAGVLDQIIDYTKQSPEKTITPASVDFMFDTMNEGFQNLHLMKKGGLILGIAGIPFGPDLPRALKNMPLLVRYGLNAYGRLANLRSWRYGVEIGFLFMLESSEDLGRIRGWVEGGLLRPIVGRIAAFDKMEDVRKGCHEVNSGKGGVGKFVVVMDGKNPSPAAT